LLIKTDFTFDTGNFKSTPKFVLEFLLKFINQKYGCIKIESTEQLTNSTNLFSARVNVHKLNTNKETKAKLVIVNGIVLFVTKDKIGGSYCLFSPFGIEHIAQY
jgi:alpha-N-acetylglucosamine transferase